MLERRSKLVASTLVALACCAVQGRWLDWRVARVAAASRSQTEGYKTVDIDRQTSMDPVSIEKITVQGQVIHPGVSTAAGREVTPGTPFEADEDWLKNMSIILKNRTDKVIARAEIMLLFPETGGGPSWPVTQYPIAVGQRPEIDSFTAHGHKLSAQPDKQPMLLAPGQTLVIQLADYIDGIQSILEQFPGALSGKPPISQVARVAIDGRQFFFVDGMRWTDLDGFAVPDPNHPGQFTNLDRGRYFPGNPSHNWPPADAPGEARHTFQP
jgi:hypothetical protein